MKTYYKPSQWRGKRLVYKSIGPAEDKRETVKGWVAISVFLLFMIVVVLLSR